MMRAKLAEIENEAIEIITNIMKGSGKDTLEVSYLDDCPIVRDNEDDYFIYTLDSVELKKNGRLIFFASSGDGSDWWDDDSIGTDVLVDIAEWMEENKEDIFDYNEVGVETDED